MSGLPPQLGLSPDPVEWIRRFLAWWTTGGNSPSTSSSSLGPSSTLSTGHLLLAAGSQPTDGWLEVDGSLQWHNQYPDLGAALGLTFDAAPPAGMFRLPPAPSVHAGLTWIIKT